MNLRDLQYVLLVAEHRHFGRAAEAANVSQPTLSAQIKKLEEELGVVLFERDSRNVALTQAGIAVVAEARNALVHVDAMRDAARVHNDPLGGELRLGVIASLSPFLVPDLLERLQFDAPRMRMVVHEGLTDALVASVVNRELDAAVVATDVAHEGLVEIALFDEPFLLAHAKGHPLGQRPMAKLADIGEGKLLLLDEGHCLRDQALDVCLMDSVDTRVKATSLTTLLRLVEMNRGVTLLPALAARMAGEVELRPLQDPGAMRKVRLVYRKNYLRDGALDVVGRAARNVAAEMGIGN
ncbi:MAG: LysR family transcriptional regulator [Alphaproteobacteria bacterium]|nr:MAG: LysR family transcriptional regulator [Alphaproteobacteria bacterium]